MANDREHLSIEDDPINLEDLVTSPRDPPNKNEYKKMQEVGEMFGFVDRPVKAKKQKKRTPYIIQHNFKMRIGMKEVLSNLTEHIGAKSDQETLELGIHALIEKEGTKDILNKFKDLINNS